MWLMLLVISLVAGADSGALPSDVKQYLYDNGLECCVAQIMSKPSWWSAGTGLDSLSDLRFLGDREIDRLPIPEVKRTILRTLAGTRVFVMRCNSTLRSSLHACACTYAP